MFTVAGAVSGLRSARTDFPFTLIPSKTSTIRHLGAQGTVLAGGSQEDKEKSRGRWMTMWGMSGYAAKPLTRPTKVQEPRPQVGLAQRNPTTHKSHNRRSN